MVAILVSWIVQNLDKLWKFVLIVIFVMSWQFKSVHYLLLSPCTAMLFYGYGFGSCRSCGWHNSLCSMVVTIFRTWENPWQFKSSQYNDLYHLMLKQMLSVIMVIVGLIFFWVGIYGNYFFIALPCSIFVEL